MPDKDYIVRKLIHDQSFRRMVKGIADPHEVSKWNHWIEASDEHHEIAKEAIAEIAGFTFKDRDDVNIAREWYRLQKSTIGKKEGSSSYEYQKKYGLKWIYKVTATLILGVLVGLGMYLYAEQYPRQVKEITQEKTLSTGANEQKTITFSDGSKAILNSNSKLTYHIDLLQHQTIEVVLEGEAYFTTGKDHDEPVFAVHTPYGVVKDIGTRFLVRVQKNRSRVILQEGKVEIHKKNSRHSAENITMGKDELLVFNTSSVLRKSKINATFYTSWATGFMQFNHTNIKKFAKYVEQRFDVDVQITDPRFANIEIDGSIYFKSLPGLVRSVSKVAQIPAYQSKDKKTVYLGDKTQRADIRQ